MRAEQNILYKYIHKSGIFINDKECLCKSGGIETKARRIM
jgi:hypothetical protein